MSSDPASIISALVNNPSVEHTDAVIRLFRETQVCDQQIAELSVYLAEPRIKLPETKRIARTDFASTGGPTSLSTIICPLALQNFGFEVVKVTVPGRPAGSIDSLAQIEGYRWKFDLHSILDVLESCGFIQMLAGEPYAKNDATFFRRRQSMNAQAVATLAISSILAKKITANIYSIGVEVRVAPFTNFGIDFESARNNGKQFCSVARLLGIDSTIIITDSHQPLQPYIGRGETVLAMIEILEGRAPSSLLQHADHCLEMAAESTGQMAIKKTSAIQLKDSFAEHLEAHGTSISNAYEKARCIADAHSFEVLSPGNGFIEYDLDKLRLAITSVQARCQELPFPDPCGIILMCLSGAKVSKNDIVMTFRCPASSFELFSSQLAKCFSIEETLLNPSRIPEVIRV